MKSKMIRNYCITGGLLVLFFVWTMLVCVVDLQPIGPEGSIVGLASMNDWFHQLTGENLEFYELTDFLSIVPFLIIFVFAVMGAIQLITRKSLAKVDSDIIALGAFYLVVLACYGLFEVLVVNYRPIFIEGKLEASYPSSTTMLAVTVFISAALQVKERVKGKIAQTALLAALLMFTVFMVLSRLLSGVHWLSDIIGGLLLSGALVMGYATVLNWLNDKREAKRMERKKALQEAMEKALSPDNI